jgi:hypothetical protein
VAVFAAAAAASRRHRAVLAGVATGLVLHFARDIAEGYPGVRVFWPLDGTSWMVSYRWFLGMIVVFTAARLVLVSVGLPHTRIPLFRTHGYGQAHATTSRRTGGAAAGVRRIWARLWELRCPRERLAAVEGLARPARDKISRPKAGPVVRWSDAAGRGRTGVRRRLPEDSLPYLDHGARR